MERYMVSMLSLANVLKSRLIQVEPTATILDLNCVFEYYLDCLLLGPLYEQATSDPMDDILVSLGVPTDIGEFLKQSTRDSIKDTIFSFLDQISSTLEYHVTWYGLNNILIEIPNLAMRDDLYENGWMAHHGVEAYQYGKSMMGLPCSTL